MSPLNRVRLIRGTVLLCACAAVLTAGCGHSAEDTAESSLADSTAEIAFDGGESLAEDDMTSEPDGDEDSPAAEDDTSLPAEKEGNSSEDESGATADGEDDPAAEITEAVIDELNDKAAEEVGLLESAEDLQLHDVDGEGSRFAFLYGGETYNAVYTPENWKIVDSYKINSKADMLIICQALTDIYPLHGSDMESFRTPEDMAQEWIQHNIAYKILPEDNRWKANAKDVDLNPADQNKSIYEIVLARTARYGAVYALDDSSARPSEFEVHYGF